MNAASTWISRNVDRLRSADSKAASKNKDKDGAKCGKACKDFILHLHCPPVPHSLRG